jgi:DNA-binding CsgD family transcriptional regulator
VERLSSADLRAAIGFASLVGEAPDLPSFAARCVSAIRGLVPCDLATYNEMNHGGRRAVALSDPPDALFAEAESVLARYLDVHPLVQHFARTGDTGTRLLSDFVTRRRLRHTGLYQELFRPIEGEYLIAVNVSAPPSVLVGLGLFRSSPDFSERDRALLDLVRPLAASAYEAVVARSALATLEAAAGDDRRSVVLVGRAGGVLYESPRARERLASYFAGGNGGLPGPVERWLVVADRPLVAERDGRRLVVRALPGAGGQRSLVLEEQLLAVTADALAVLPLTRRERQVLALAATGMTNAQIGGELLISPRTVKKHLEGIYGKLGVGTRAAAVAAALVRVRDGELYGPVRANGPRSTPSAST